MGKSILDKLKEEITMEKTLKKKLIMTGMVFALTFGALTGCGDGVDQDNGITDGEHKDEAETKNPETN